MGEKFEKRAAYGINNITLVPCFVVRDAELKYTKNGKPCSRFSVGYDDSYKGENGVVDSIYFFNCVIWGKQAESISSYLTKGRKLDLVGKLTQRSYEGNDGKKNNVVEISVASVNFRPSAKKDGVAAKPKEQGAQQEAPKPAPENDFGEEFGDNDVPF